MLCCVDFQVSKDMVNASTKLNSLEKEKLQLTSNLENQHLAKMNRQQEAERSLGEAQGVLEIQLQQMERTIVQLQKEIEGK